MSTLTVVRILVPLQATLSASIIDGKRSVFQVLGSSEIYGGQLRQLPESEILKVLQQS